MRHNFPLTLLAFAGVLHAQWTGSGSSGADGALNLTTPGTAVFSPEMFPSAGRTIHGNIYNFTSIYIAKGVTLKVSAKYLSGPVFWLSQGPVIVEGVIDLNGEDGSAASLALAGAGGFSGGAAGMPGSGPAAFVPNTFLVPLLGGFGGAGGKTSGGGAGGGALLIASSTSIAMNGSVMANGGASSDGKGGHGGAIRLIAPVIEGAGILSAAGGAPESANGLIRLEAFENRFAGDLRGTPLAVGKPFGLFLPPDPPPSLKVVSVRGVTPEKQDGAAVPALPVTVMVEARFVPPGAVIRFHLFPESGDVQTLAGKPLQGTFELSHSTTLLSLPEGLAGARIEASWERSDPAIEKRRLR